MRCRTTSVIAGTATALVVAVGASAASADDCTSFARCDLKQTQTLIVPMKNQTIAAQLKVRDTQRARSLYERLLPPGYEVPKVPLIGVYMVTVDVPSRTFGPLDSGVRGVNDITHYLEGSLSLRTVRNGEPGWWHLGMPVDSENARTTGLPIGYPKYRAKLRFEQAPGGSWFANSAVGGRQTLKLAWRPAKVPVSPDLANFLGEPFYTLAKPLRGPERWRTKLTAMSAVPVSQITDGQIKDAGADNVTRVPAGQPGLVDVSIDPDLNRYDTETPDKMPDLLSPGESLADLIDTEQTVPGVYNDIQETLLYQMNRESQKFEGGEYWKRGNADQGPAGGPPSDARPCVSRRAFTIRLSRAVRSARVTVDGKPARVRRRKGRLTAFLDLRGKPAGSSVNVRIAGRGAGGRRITRTRTYRTCTPKH